MSPLLLSIIVSACLGALVGLIRQWSDQSSTHQAEADLGGVRTYTLLAVLGCVAANLTSAYSAAVMPVVVGAVALHLTAMQLRGVTAGSQPGSTTLTAAILTCLVGGLVQWEHTQAALLVAALTAVMVGLKQPLHALTRHFTTDDIRATLQFIAITGVVLPLVPNKTYGPFNAFNPNSTWLMVVLISGLGFVGYVLMRMLGANAGILLTSLLGGLASSTATTLAFSRRSKDEVENSANYALGVVLASTVMLARVLVVIAVISTTLAVSLLLPFGLMALPGIGFALWLWFSRQRSPGAVAAPRISNPLSLATSIKFALAYAVVAFLVKAATALQAQASLLPLSFLSGLTDMDAIALSMAQSFGSGELLAGIAAKSVIVGAMANSVMKAGIAAMIGSPRLRRDALVMFGLTVAAGAIGFGLVR